MEKDRLEKEAKEVKFANDEL